MYKMQKCCTGSQTIEITWVAPHKTYETFLVRYKEKKSDSDPIFKTTKTESYTLKNLKSETEYEIVICGIDGDDEWKLFDTTQSTIKSPAAKLKDEFEYEGQEGSLSIYRLQLKEDILAPGIMQYTLDSNTKSDGLIERTMLLIGQEKSGKSTMVDAIFNYIADVPFADGYRFKLSRNQNTIGVNVIQWYRVMKRESFKIPWHINIIDINLQTISSGETNHAIRILKESLSIDAVMIVMPVHYILDNDHKTKFESVIESFSKENHVDIYPMVTFDDTGGEVFPCVTELLRYGLIRNDHTLFKFNNSNLFNSNPKMMEQWINRDDNLCRLFRQLNSIANRPPKSNRKRLFNNMDEVTVSGTKSVNSVSISDRKSCKNWHEFIYYAFSYIIPMYGCFIPVDEYFIYKTFDNRAKRNGNFGIDHF